MAKQTKAEAAKKAERRRIEVAYYAGCQNIQISILDMGRIFQAGHDAIAEGADDETLKTKIRAFVDTIRLN